MNTVMPIIGGLWRLPVVYSLSQFTNIGISSLKKNNNPQFQQWGHPSVLMYLLPSSGQNVLAYSRL